MIGCDKLYVDIQRVQASFAHAEYSVKLDEPSICRYGLGTLETERSSVNHIVDMINIVMFTIENYSISRTTPFHVMIGYGLVDLDHMIT